MWLEKFHEPGIFNYSVLLLSEDKSTLYVGAREAVFALNARNVSEKWHEVRRWHPAPAPPGRLAPPWLQPLTRPTGLRARGRSPRSFLPSCVRPRVSSEPGGRSPPPPPGVLHF